MWLKVSLIPLMLLCFLTSSAQKPLIEDDTLKAAQLFEQGMEVSKMHSYKEASKLIAQAKDIYRHHEIWKKVVRCEVRLSIIADNFNSPELKNYHATEALNLAKTYLGEHDLLLASAYRQKAEALMWIEQLDSANHFLNLALPIFRSELDWIEYGWTEVLLAVNYINTYQVDSSEYHLDELAKLLENVTFTKVDFEELQSALFEFRGITYELQGDYNKAIHNLNEAIEIGLKNRNISTIDSGFISDQFNALGSIYLIKGDYLRAEDNFLQSIQYNKNASFDPILMYNIGIQYIKQEKYLDAISYFETSANLTNLQNFNSTEERISFTKNKIEALNSLCYCYRALGNFEKAMAHCRKAEMQQVDYKKYITWASMGHVFLEQKEPKKAIYYLNKAIDDLTRNAEKFQDRVLIKSKILYLLGEAYLQLKDKEEALVFFQKSLITNHRNFRDSLNFEKNPSLDGIYEPIYFLETISAKAKTQALLASDIPSLTLAQASYQLTIQWIDSLQASYALASTQINWSATFKSIYEEAINTSFALYDSTGDIAFLEHAFNYSEKSRSSILLEQLKSKKGKYTAGIPDSLLQKGKDLQLDIVFYKEKLADAMEEKESAKTKLYQGYLSQSRLELASLEEKLEAEYPKFYQSKYASEYITIKQVQQELLDKNSALVEYFLGDSTAYVFVISSDTATMKAIADLDQLQTNISRFLDLVVDIDSYKRNAKTAITDYNQVSLALYSQLFALPVSEIFKNLQRFVIVPDGSLNAFPFEALTDKEYFNPDLDFAKLSFLIYKYAFQYSYSAQLLLQNKRRNADLPPNMDCLGLAPSYQLSNPISLRGDFDQLRNASGNLTGTAYEIAQISKYINGKYCIGESATEHLFKAEAHQFGLLHLAMHGDATLENPDFNHLKFSNKVISDLEDNLLHQYEISGMDLHAQLIVLSACETGLGKYEKGEGVFSLARSFMYAGVPSVVMSLWRVSDASTSQLMPYFYENLSANASKVAALRDAKLSYLKSADLTMRHPFYWSAFVVIGDGSALKTSDYTFFYWAIGGIFLVLIGWVIWKAIIIKSLTFSGESNH